MRLYSNEIVFRGHPDKVCDQISGAILDACLRQDKSSRVGVECCGGKFAVFITGEITTSANINIEETAERVLQGVGYPHIEVINDIGMQSPDIAQGVDIGGAGDNGMMFGYACDDTPDLLPTAMVILQTFARSYEGLRKTDNHFRSDGKAQITGVYDDDFRLAYIKDFTVCYQNDELDREYSDVLIEELANTTAACYGVKIERILINPTGKFERGGFAADAGLTGRKIVVDAYQSFANVGGGCMNGKDPSKVDVSGAYIARKFACEELVLRGLRWCEVQISYAIGQVRPLAIYIDSNLGNITPKEEHYHRAEPRNIIDECRMLEPKYEERARYGHFTARGQGNGKTENRD